MLAWDGGFPVNPRKRTLCRCGHNWDTHEHYRAGEECALCMCPIYTRPLKIWRFWVIPPKTYMPRRERPLDGQAGADWY